MERDEFYSNLEKAKCLMHYGIPGQRRGYRRFQNEDGSLTPAGEQRYNGGKIGSNNRETYYNDRSELNNKELDYVSRKEDANRVSLNKRDYRVGKNDANRVSLIKVGNSRQTITNRNDYGNGQIGRPDEKTGLSAHRYKGRGSNRIDRNDPALNAARRIQNDVDWVRNHYQMTRQEMLENNRARQTRINENRKKAVNYKLQPSDKHQPGDEPTKRNAQGIPMGGPGSFNNPHVANKTLNRRRRKMDH